MAVLQYKTLDVISGFKRWDLFPEALQAWHRSGLWFQVYMSSLLSHKLELDKTYNLLSAMMEHVLAEKFV